MTGRQRLNQGGSNTMLEAALLFPEKLLRLPGESEYHSVRVATNVFCHDQHLVYALAVHIHL